MAERDRAGSDVPPFVVVGIHLLQLELVEIECGHVRGSGFVALHAVGKVEPRHLVAWQVGDLPNDVVPFVVLEDDVVHAHLAVTVGHGLRPSVMKRDDERDHADAGQIRVSPEGEPVPCRPILSRHHAAG